MLMRQQTAFILSVNVITQDDTGMRFAVVPIASISWLVMAIWQCRQVKNRVSYHLSLLVDNVANRLDIAGKLLAIGFSALIFGVIS